MLVSVIIPVYRVEPYVERCLLSVVNQTYFNIEIIFVNDCTPDNSIGVIENFVRNNPEEKRITIINHEVNKGLSEARNTGIRTAKGEYIYFLDSDDEITLDCIEVLVSNCQGDDFVMGGFLKGDGDPFCETMGGKLENENIQKAYFGGRIYDMACNKLIEKKFILENQLFFKPGLIHEDLLWTYKCCMLARSIRSLEKPTYIYHIIDGSLNTNFTSRNLKSLEEIYNEIKDDIILKNLYKNPIAYSFLLNLNFNIKSKAISSSKISSLEFSKYCFPIKHQLYSFRSTLKCMLLNSPSLLQYLLLSGINRYYLKK